MAESNSASNRIEPVGPSPRSATGMATSKTSPRARSTAGCSARQVMVR